MLCRRTFQDQARKGRRRKIVFLTHQVFCLIENHPPISFFPSSMYRRDAIFSQSTIRNNKLCYAHVWRWLKVFVAARESSLD